MSSCHVSTATDTRAARELSGRAWFGASRARCSARRLPLAILLAVSLETNTVGAQEIDALNVSLVGSIQVEDPWGPSVEKDFTKTDLFVSGDYAYLGSDSNVLHVIDISSPEDMRIAAHVDIPGPAFDVVVDGESQSWPFNTAPTRRLASSFSM